MLFYSHWLDLVGKLFSLTLFIVFLIKTGLIETIRPLMARTPNPHFFAFGFLFAILIVYYLIIHRPVIDVVVTSLYVRMRFGVQVSWREAKQLRKLFCLNMRTLQWHPMKEVRSLPVDQRLPALVAAANE
jgi:hypothetical protein